MCICFLCGPPEALACITEASRQHANTVSGHTLLLCSARAVPSERDPRQHSSSGHQRQHTRARCSVRRVHCRLSCKRKTFGTPHLASARRPLLLLLTPAAPTICPAAACVDFIDKEEEARKSPNRVLYFRRNADYDRLIEVCSRKISENPRNIRALLIRASSNLKKGAWHGALAQQLGNSNCSRHEASFIACNSSSSSKFQQGGSHRLTMAPT